MSRFLSHEQTKADLTEYLAEKPLDYNKDSSKLVITSAAGHTRSNKDVGPFPDNNLEEADTLMICFGVSATERNSRDAEMTFCSPDTDVLVLIIASYDLLPKNTSISVVSGVQQIKPLWTALGPEKGLTSIPCILWGRQHWKVCTNRQGNLVQAVPGVWRWCHHGPVHALWWHGCDGGLPAINFCQVCVHCILSKGPPDLKHSWSTLAPILQIHGRKWEPTT